jgi:tetratricopeptide (TPR) repeat protein/tRNA A-37 threonylcarbamoyl transferase component Bud32
MCTPATTSEAGAAFDAAPGRRLGRFELVKLLGEGGMGTVWRARDPDLRRDVAIKVIKPERGDLARFEREARLAAQLAHPHIAAIYEIGREEGRPWLAMQLVEGETLRHRPPDGVRQAVDLARDAALAVQYAHDRGIIHRDLKPDNLMVAPREGKAHIYVMDFGLAREVAAPAELTASGMMVGTPAYMSPEQARGDRVDARSDVYSLGATLYELIAGRRPFTTASVLDLVMEILHEEPPSLRSVKAGVARELDTVVLKCLEKDPARRYGSMRELAEDLQRWLDGEPVIASPPSLISRVRRGVARRKVLMASIAAAVVAAALVAALAVPGWMKARADADAFRDLGVLRTELVLARQGFHNPHADPAAVVARIRQVLARVDAFIARRPLPAAWHVKAHGHIQLDELAEAEAAARESIRIAPDFAPGESLLATILVERAVLDLHGDESTIGRRTGRVTPLLEEAARRLERPVAEEAFALWGLVRTDDDEIAGVVARAMLLKYSRGDALAAMRELREAEKRLPAAEYRYWASVWAADGEKMAHIDAAIARRPHYPAALLQRANLCGRRDRKRQLEDLDAALRASPRHLYALVNRTSARIAVGDTDGAARDIALALEVAPDNVYALAGRGELHRILGRVEEAARDLERVIRLEPGFAFAHASLGWMRVNAGDLEAGLAGLDRAVELDPEYVPALHNRGVARTRARKFDGAVEDLRRAMRLDPGSATLHADLGLALEGRGDWHGAVAEFEAAVKIDPANATAHYCRGSLLLHLGEFEKAIEAFDRAVEVRGGYAEAMVNGAVARQERGRALAREGRAEDAIRMWGEGIDLCERAATAKPGLAPAYGVGAMARTLRADAFMARKRNDLAGPDYTKALDLYDAALRADPAFDGALNNKINLMMRLHWWPEVVQAATRLMELRPGDPEPILKRGEALLASGRRAEAAADLERALSAAPQGWGLRAHAQALLDRARKPE